MHLPRFLKRNKGNRAQSSAVAPSAPATSGNAPVLGSSSNSANPNHTSTSQPSEVNSADQTQSQNPSQVTLDSGNDIYVDAPETPTINVATPSPAQALTPRVSPGPIPTRSVSGGQPRATFTVSPVSSRDANRPNSPLPTQGNPTRQLHTPSVMLGPAASTPPTIPPTALTNPSAVALGSHASQAPSATLPQGAATVTTVQADQSRRNTRIMMTSSVVGAVAGVAGAGASIAQVAGGSHGGGAGSSSVANYAVGGGYGGGFGGSFSGSFGGGGGGGGGDGGYDSDSS